MIYVLFGPPGVGKTYIGTLLSKTLGFTFFDTDEVYTDEEKTLLQSGKYDDSVRDRIYTRITDRIGTLLQETTKDAVVAGAFTLDKYRVQLMRKFAPHLVFVRVKAPLTVATQRSLAREVTGHMIDHPTMLRLWKQFESPSFVCQTLVNDHKTDDELVAAFKRLL